MSLNKLRKQVDSIDKKITGLLNARAKVILNVGKLKEKNGSSVYSPDREKQVLEGLIRMNKGPLSKDALSAIYREIMSSSLSLEKPLKVAYLGPEASFSNLAALKKFGSQISYIPCDNISGVFSEVERGSADYGVVPIENSIEGAISYTLDMFMESDLKICAQLMLDVSHNLLANCPMNKIKRIYSNPNVLGQCRIWLQQNLSGVETIVVPSTTRAAQIAKNEKGSACIASLLAAKVYKLKLIAQGIEDSPHNITRFLVIGKTIAKQTGHDKISILFSIKDSIGALHDMLVPFKKYGINLTKIESRPSKKKAWDYYFFVDLKGHQDNPKIKHALNELENKCKFLKILGSYPNGE